MSSQATVLFGAGASKSLGGPITDEILPHVLGVKKCRHCGHGRFNVERLKDEYVDANTMLMNLFNVPERYSKRDTNDYPALPLLITLLDQSIRSDEPLISNKSVDDLKNYRDSLLTIIYDSLVGENQADLLNTLVTRLVDKKNNPLWKAMTRIVNEIKSDDKVNESQVDIKVNEIQADTKKETQITDPLYRALDDGDLTVITTNYDTYIENTLFAIQKSAGGKIKPAHYGCKPDFGVAYSKDKWRDYAHFGTVLKLHGSIAWGYCSSCTKLYDRFTTLGQKTIENLGASLIDAAPEDASQFRYKPDEPSRCRECGNAVQLLMLAPSILKAYHNIHLARIWARALHALRQSERWYIIGYSLPSDDFEICRLLVRATQFSGKPKKIFVVQKNSSALEAKEVKGRFTRLLGTNIDYYRYGCETWAR